MISFASAEEIKQMPIDLYHQLANYVQKHSINIYHVNRVCIAVRWADVVLKTDWYGTGEVFKF